MRSIAIGRVLRMVRIRRSWRQEDVAVRAKLSPATIGRHENGTFRSAGALEQHAGALGLRVDVRLVGRGGELVRLADEEHAAIVEGLATAFSAVGYLVETEASFNEWGERGRIDLLAFDQRTGTMVIVEVKTQLLDLQDLFGSLDVRNRLATRLAQRRGWGVRCSATVLAVAATAINRRIVRDHATLFSQFVRRRFSASHLRGTDARVLCWISPTSEERKGWMAGRQRVRTSAR